MDYVKQILKTDDEVVDGWAKNTRRYWPYSDMSCEESDQYFITNYPTWAQKIAATTDVRPTNLGDERNCPGKIVVIGSNDGYQGGNGGAAGNYENPGDLVGYVQ